MIQAINEYFETNFDNVENFLAAFEAGEVDGLGDSFEDDFDALLGLLRFIADGERMVNEQ